MKKIIYIISIVACTISSTSGFGQNTSFLHKLEDKRTDAKTSFYTFITGTAKPISLATPLTFWITGMINKKTTLKKNQSKCTILDTKIQELEQKMDHNHHNDIPSSRKQRGGGAHSHLLELFVDR